MSYRPQIKKSDGTMQDLPLDAETVQGQEPGALAFKDSITNTDIAANAAIAQSKISGLSASLASKQNSITGGASTVTTANLTASRALVSNTAGKIAVSAVTSTELGYLSGVKSNIQTQIDNLSGKGEGITIAHISTGSTSGIFPSSVDSEALNANPEKFAIQQGDRYFYYTDKFTAKTVQGANGATYLLYVCISQEWQALQNGDTERTTVLYYMTVSANRWTVYRKKLQPELCEYSVGLSMGGDYFDFSFISNITDVTSSPTDLIELATAMYYDGFYATYQGSGTWSINDFIRIAPFVSENMQTDCRMVGITVGLGEWFSVGSGSTSLYLMPVFADPDDYINGSGYYKVSDTYQFSVPYNEAEILYFHKRTLNTDGKKASLLNL